MNLGKFGKAIVAALGVASVVLADNDLSYDDVFQIILAVMTVLGVYSVENSKDEDEVSGESTTGRHRL